jgi:hypothetical protein
VPTHVMLIFGMFFTGNSGFCIPLYLSNFDLDTFLPHTNASDAKSYLDHFLGRLEVRKRMLQLCFVKTRIGEECFGRLAVFYFFFTVNFAALWQPLVQNSVRSKIIVEIQFQHKYMQMITIWERQAQKLLLNAIYLVERKSYGHTNMTISEVSKHVDIAKNAVKNMFKRQEQHIAIHTVFFIFEDFSHNQLSKLII